MKKIESLKDITENMGEVIVKLPIVAERGDVFTSSDINKLHTIDSVCINKNEILVNDESFVEFINEYFILSQEDVEYATSPLKDTEDFADRLCQWSKYYLDAYDVENTAWCKIYKVELTHKGGLKLQLVYDDVDEYDTDAELYDEYCDEYWVKNSDNFKVIDPRKLNELYNKLEVV